MDFRLINFSSETFENCSSKMYSRLVKTEDLKYGAKGNEEKFADDM